MKDVISITGAGIICAIGNDKVSVLDSLRNRESGVRSVKYLETVHGELPVGEVQMSDDEMKAMLGLASDTVVSRTSLMGALAIKQALSQAGIEKTEGRRVALISGTTVGVMDVTEMEYHRNKAVLNVRDLPKGNECGKSTEQMAALAGLEDVELCTVSTACSSALNSIIVGAEMLRHSEADIVIAGGSEALSRFHLNGFNSLMILDGRPCRPFDADRAGLNLGEGAAFVVLQKDASRPLAYVSGYGNRCDAFHQTASSENGEGAFLAMTEALESAGLKASDIDYVNAHGTGTQNNDMSESRALSRVFGDNIPPVSSTKGFTGHTTSASGAIETVICLLAMQNDMIPANLGWEKPSPGLVQPSMGVENAVLNNVMCNSFGFGGNDSSLVLSRSVREDGTVDMPVAEYETVANVTIDDVAQLAELREFVSPMESRRMCTLMKASLLSSLRAAKEAALQCPDAVIAATSGGMLQTSIQFLEDMEENCETMLKPTLFMMSTHNTVASAIAIRLGCHGYNITYSQGEASSQWALRDARRLLESGKASSVLVTSFDESADGGFRSESMVIRKKL
ncbi:MAG: beta-ketoacyl-[acyl-carrier-protein] synthase family protein [Bacteroidales bacterium]|nr:beta-ketoacyl-[acyl-carrier-protein] synthase family protein [Bacteroidales bacterium]